jgi:hypothetical protein
MGGWPLAAVDRVPSHDDDVRAFGKLCRAGFGRRIRALPKPVKKKETRPRDCWLHDTLAPLARHTPTPALGRRPRPATHARPTDRAPSSQYQRTLPSPSST